jgi:BirA family biotin operon repressor/biotin-[acetyl-CoA-carboxylase] ligase
MLTQTKFTDTPDRLLPEEIAREIKTKTVGSAVISYDRVTSTMDIAKNLAHTNFKNGTVIFAEEQTSGRGRSDHSWFCPKFKGMLFTILLKYNIKPDHLCLLTGTMAVSITETIRETLQLPAEIKWPNDIIIGGKKIGGILVEIERGIKKQPVFLVGVGINVNNTEHELPQKTNLPVTSLSIENNGPVNRTQLARALLQNTDRWYHILKDEHFGYITKQWKELCITIGKTLTISDGGNEYTGTVIDISNNGGLMLKLPDGQLKIFRGEYTTIKHQQNLQHSNSYLRDDSFCLR